MDLLTQKYKELIKLCKIDEDIDKKHTSLAIRNILSKFCHSHNNVAIWCNGEHTRMLMADYMDELKNVNIIIDNKLNGQGDGFNIIRENEIIDNRIDGIIISSYGFKDEIKSNLENNYNNIPYLDIYEELRKIGIGLEAEYYKYSHPNNTYLVINKYRNNIRLQNNLEYSYIQLINKLIVIKDFFTAAEVAEQFLKIASEPEKVGQVLTLLLDICEYVKYSIRNIDRNNILMLCIDSMRKQDFYGRYKNTMKAVNNNVCCYHNAYSVSTSTYESLIPTYGEYNSVRKIGNIVKEKDCRFICEAVKNNRRIHFYTDGDKFIDSDKIKYSGCFQTITEKLWNFLIDANNEKNGLFYIHVLQESHFWYANAYTEAPFVAGVSTDVINFNNNEIINNLKNQKLDADRYLDNILSVLLDNIKSNFVVYADHGYIMPDEYKIDNKDNSAYSYHNNLIQIPLIIKQNGNKSMVGDRYELVSLMQLNEILCNLINNRMVMPNEHNYIKVQRTGIYNPKLKKIYREKGRERELMAFELFIFIDGYKLCVYENGEMVFLYKDKKVENAQLQAEYYNAVANDVTVYKLS